MKTKKKREKTQEAPQNPTEKEDPSLLKKTKSLKAGPNPVQEIKDLGLRKEEKRIEANIVEDLLRKTNLEGDLLLGPTEGQDRRAHLECGIDQEDQVRIRDTEIKVPQ